MTLDMDATPVFAEKRAAQWTYLKRQGTMPMLGHLAETVWQPLCRDGEAVDGQATPACLIALTTLLSKALQTDRMRLKCPFQISNAGFGIFL